MDKVFVVRRLIDNDCYSCGGLFIQYLHFVIDEDVAKNHVEVLKEEHKAAMVCNDHRFKADNAPGLNRSNWEAVAREVLQFDKAYFDEDKTLGSLTMVDYDYQEINAFQPKETATAPKVRLASKITESHYQSISEGLGKTVRSVVHDGEFRINHPNDVIVVLLVGDEVILDEKDKVVAYQTNLGNFYQIS